MSITTTGNLGPMILQSLAPAMLYVPTPTMNYILVCDKVSMPANGGTTCRFNNIDLDKSSLIDLEILWDDRAQAKAA